MNATKRPAPTDDTIAFEAEIDRLVYSPYHFTLAEIQTPKDKQ
jgi:hypothetical protein